MTGDVERLAFSSKLQTQNHSLAASKGLAGVFASILDNDLRHTPSKREDRYEAEGQIRSSIATVTAKDQADLFSRITRHQPYAHIELLQSFEVFHQSAFGNKPLAGYGKTVETSKNRQWFFEFTEDLRHLVENDGDPNEVAGIKNILKQLEKQHVERMILDSLNTEKR